MQKINVVKPFRHVVTGEIHATPFEVGPQQVDARTAEVALAEGWAVPFVEPALPFSVAPESVVVVESGPRSLDSGPERPSSSPRRGRPPKRRT